MANNRIDRRGDSSKEEASMKTRTKVITVGAAPIDVAIMDRCR